MNQCFFALGLVLSLWGTTLPAQADKLEDLLQEVKIPTLPARTREALDYLVQQKGFKDLAAHEVITQLQNGQAVDFSILAGPTHEARHYPLQGLESLLTVEAQVKAQHLRDQYRPDYAQAMGIFQQRIPALLQQLQQQEQQSTTKAAACVQNFKQLQAEQKSVQNNLSEIQAYLQNLQAEQAALSPQYEAAHQHFTALANQYKTHQHKHDHLQKELNEKNRQRNTLLQRIEQTWAQVKQEETLIWKDAANAKIHRERAEAHRKVAAYLQHELQRLEALMQPLPPQIATEATQMNLILPHYKAAEARFQQEKTGYDKVLEKLKSTQHAQHQLTATSQEISAKVQANQQEQARWIHLIPLLRESQAQLAQDLSTLPQLQNYAGYRAYQAEHLQHLQRLQQSFQDVNYQTYFGSDAAQKFAPLAFLIQAMQKDPEPQNIS